MFSQDMNDGQQLQQKVSQKLKQELQEMLNKNQQYYQPKQNQVSQSSMFIPNLYYHYNHKRQPEYPQIYKSYNHYPEQSLFKENYDFPIQQLQNQNLQNNNQQKYIFPKQRSNPNLFRYNQQQPYFDKLHTEQDAADLYNDNVYLENRKKYKSRLPSSRGSNIYTDNRSNLYQNKQLQDIRDFNQLESPKKDNFYLENKKKYKSKLPSSRGSNFFQDNRSNLQQSKKLQSIDEFSQLETPKNSRIQKQRQNKNKSINYSAFNVQPLLEINSDTFISSEPTIVLFLDNLNIIKQNSNYENSFSDSKLGYKIEIRLQQQTNQTFSEQGIITSFESEPSFDIVNNHCKLHKQCKIFLNFDQIEKYYSKKAENLWMIFEFYSKSSENSIQQIGWLSVPLYFDGYLRDGAIRLLLNTKINIGNFESFLFKSPTAKKFPIIETSSTSAKIIFQIQAFNKNMKQIEPYSMINQSQINTKQRVPIILQKSKKKTMEEYQQARFQQIIQKQVQDQIQQSKSSLQPQQSNQSIQ